MESCINRSFLDMKETNFKCLGKAVWENMTDVNNTLIRELECLSVSKNPLSLAKCNVILMSIDAGAGALAALLYGDCQK